MVMRYKEIFEKAPVSNVFGLAKKAYASLGREAKSAIDLWETANWTEGDLVNHIKANDEVAQEIEAAFAPVRALLPAKVSLYRGIIKDGSYTAWQKGILESWSSDRRVAEHFAGMRTSKEWREILKPVRSEEEIDQLVAKYEASGYLKLDGRYYIRNRDHPQYYNIYNSRKSFITDGDDLKKDLMSDRKWALEYNQKILDKAEVFSSEIDRNRIVWITNSLGSKEFIVRK
jgi:hypothetical protein